MRLQHFLIGLLMLGLFTSVIVGFAVRTYSTMGVTLDNQTSKAFSAFQERADNTTSGMIDWTDQAQADSLGGVNSASDTSKTYQDNIIGSGLKVVSNIPKTYGMFVSFLYVIQDSIGIDPIFIGVFVACVLIIIAMIFASSLLRNRL